MSATRAVGIVGLLVVLIIISVCAGPYFTSQRLKTLEKKYKENPECKQPINMKSSKPKYQNTDEECIAWKNEYQKEINKCFADPDSLHCTLLRLFG